MSGLFGERVVLFLAGVGTGFVLCILYLLVLSVWAWYWDGRTQVS